MPSVALVLLQSLSSASATALGWELARFSAAVILLLVAFASFAFYLARRKSRDLTLICFGTFCSLYAVRLLGELRVVRALFHVSPDFWGLLNWLITCTIVLPFGAFLYLLVSHSGVRRIFRWMLTAQALFAIFGILAVRAGISLARLQDANNVLVLATFAIAIAIAVVMLLRPGSSVRPEIRTFALGFFVWMLFVVRANLAGLRRLRGENTEFLGFLFFVACLGYIVVRRSLATEERLLAINKELEIARQIQSSTLPQSVPVIPGLDIAARYVPMAAVAGDFYDFLPHNGDQLGVLVADVTGHGVPAALIASMLKVAFAAQSPHADDPARVLTGLNRALCGKFESHFVTAAYVFLNPAQNFLRYAGAGHPPLFLSPRESPEIRQIEQNGVMLGLFPEAEYSSIEIPFTAGDRCFLYTDGILEAMNLAQEEYGKVRLTKLLETQRNSPANTLAAACLDEISHWAGHSLGRRQEDDITLVVLDFQQRKAASA